MLKPKVIAALDPGIRDVVVMLDAAGWDTCDSGDGVSKPPAGRVFDEPHVFVQIKGDIAEQAQVLLSQLGDGWYVEGNYSTFDGKAMLGAFKSDGPTQFNCGQCKVLQEESDNFRMAMGNVASTALQTLTDLSDLRTAVELCLKLEEEEPVDQPAAYARHMALVDAKKVLKAVLWSTKGDK